LKVLKKQHFVPSGAAGAGSGAGVGVGVGAAAGTVFDGPFAFPPLPPSTDEGVAVGTAVGVVKGAFPFPFPFAAGAGAVGVVAGAFPFPFAAGAGAGTDLELLAPLDDEAPAADVAPWTVGSVVSFGKLCMRHSNIIQYHQYRYVSFDYHSVSFRLHTLGLYIIIYSMIIKSSGSPSWSL
jgi:hypothetical protein